MSGWLVTHGGLVAYTSIVVHITYTTGTRTLPEYTYAPSGLCIYFRQSTRACGRSITYKLVKQKKLKIFNKKNKDRSCNHKKKLCKQEVIGMSSR